MSYVEDATTSSEWAAVAAGTHHDPHAVLGAHPSTDAGDRTVTVIRARRPLAASVAAVFGDGSRLALEHVAHGIWEAQHDGAPVPYRLATAYGDDDESIVGDPYRHLPTLGDIDLHLIAEGRHERLWQVLGAHPRTVEGDTGVAFAVWAPNATAVRVVGYYN